MLANKNAGVTIVIVTANPDRIPQQFINKFFAQHGTVKVITSKDFHDRFVILDNREVYVFGASLKDLGSKCFEVSKLEDTADFLSRLSSIV